MSAGMTAGPYPRTGHIVIKVKTITTVMMPRDGRRMNICQLDGMIECISSRICLADGSAETSPTI